MKALNILLLVPCFTAPAVAQTTKAELPDVTIRSHNGRPMLFVRERPLALTAYSPMFWEKPVYVRQVPRFGPHKIGTYFIGPPPIPGDFFGTQFWVGDDISNRPLLTIEPRYLTGIDDQVNFILKSDPDARFIVRWAMSEPQSWKKLHPDEYFVSEDGTPQAAPSLASDLFWKKATQFSKAIIEHCESSEFAPRIIAYANFARTEGTHEPVTANYLYDHNPLMTARWREFLRVKYGTVEALRAAYSDDNLTFENAPVPKSKLRRTAPEVSAELYWQNAKDNRALRDYLELMRDLFHLRFRQVGAAMDAATQRKIPILIDALKQGMQGWNASAFFDKETSQQLAGAELMAGSGSMDVTRLFDSPGFDGLITPHDYQARGVGGVFEPEGMADSAVLRGKYFLTEMDTRTYVDKYNAYGRARNDREVAAITWRNIATALTRGIRLYWMDLSDDWFSTPAIQQLIGRQVEVLKESVNWRHDTVPGIAVILDDRAVLETNGSGGYLNEAVLWEQKLGLARSGIPFRFYQFDDLNLETFPKHHIFYFPNLFRADAARIATLQKKVFCDGNVIVWGPGSGISDGTTIGPESAERLTGFRLEMPYRANFPRRTVISNFEHPVTRELAAETVIGGPLAYGPMLFPTDGVELGRAWTKIGRDAVGLAVKSFGRGARGEAKDLSHLGKGNYAGIFTSAIPLPADFWRGVARFSRTHIYSDSGDITLADQSIVALHSLKSGEKILRLPQESTVFDVVTGKLVGHRLRSIHFQLNAPETRVFRLTKPGH